MTDQLDTQMTSTDVTTEATPVDTNIETQATEVAQEAANIAPQGFIDSLADDLKGEASLQDFKDINGLAKSYVASQRMLGNSIRIPGEDASIEAKKEFYEKLTKVPGVTRLPDSEDPESINQFYNSLGRPESADKYDLGLPEDLPVDNSIQDSFKEVAHKLGLNNKQAQELAKWELGIQQQHLLQEQQYLEQSEKQLKDLWGSDYGNRMAGAKFAAQYYEEKFPGSMKMLLNGSNGNNPAVISMLSEMAQNLKESGTLQGAGSLQYGMSAEEAAEAKSEILSNKNHAYWNSSDPQHKVALEKVYKLNQIIANE